jgi:transposase
VLEVLSQLLSEGRTDEVLAVIRRLVERNGELERLLAQSSRGGARKNEGVSAAQLKLFLDELAESNAEELKSTDAKLRLLSGIDEPKAEEPDTSPKKRAPVLRRPPPENLRRIDNEIRVPESERACPCCGGERRCIGHDLSEVVELIPAELVVRVDRREKLACPQCEGELVRAPMGNKVVSGGRMGSTLVADLLVSKYRDGLPLHRQKERFGRLGLPVSVSTLADQVMWSTDLLRPLWRAAQDLVLGSRVMHLDATGLPVLDRNKESGKKLGSLWGYVGDKHTALMLYASTGKKAGQKPGELGPEDMLKRRNGYVVADASGLFDASFKRPDLVECGCNMHARRYFVKAFDAGDKRAALPLAAFKKLYEIEAEVRGRDADSIRTTRQTDSKPVYDGLVEWCEAHKPHEPPSSPLGAAIRYLHNHQVALRRFLDDGVIPIDNGIVERLHVRTALTRKNYLFAGSDAGAERAAIAYTILACCQIAEVNPVEYLTTVLPLLGRRVRLVNIPALLPATWKTTRQSATQTA